MCVFVPLLKAELPTECKKYQPLTQELVRLMLSVPTYKHQHNY